jgi:hypothetical protein
MQLSVYESLPYIYLVVGLFALFGVDSALGQICGALLIAVGIYILRMRAQYRKREEIRNLIFHRHQ